MRPHNNTEVYYVVSIVIPRNQTEVKRPPLLSVKTNRLIKLFAPNQFQHR